MPTTCTSTIDSQRSRAIWRGSGAARDRERGQIVSAVMQQQTSSPGEWVVRAGIATRDSLIAGYAEHKAVSGLFGFSVQYHAGATVDELARAGQFANAQISYAPDRPLAALLAAHGYRMRLVPSPGGGYHHTFCVLYDATGTMLQQLPLDAADAISAALVRIPNPHRVRHP